VQIVAVGISHTSASLSLREQLAVAGESLPDALHRLRENVAEAFILSTCNRVELYALCGHEGSGAEVLRQFLAAHGDVPIRTVRDVTCAYGHSSAVRHLLRVAAGLESMVVGENEILGQVRRAIAAARQAGALGPVLDRLGDAALACGKRTRVATALGRDGESVASVAMRLAVRERGRLEGANVVVLGAGETAGQTLASLVRVADVRVTLVNRTYDRAAELAAAHGAEARPWDELAQVLAAADVVIGCTGAQTPVLSATMLVEARDAEVRPLLCLDLAVPRDIDPGVASLPGVTLIDLDRIELETTARCEDRARDLVRAESIVDQDTERFMEWWRGRGVASTVARLHAHAGAIRDAEVERALTRLSDVSPQARAVIHELATRMVGKLLHEPTVTLKRDPEGANMAVVVERLFALGDGGAQPEIHQESKAS
jgi:glutamyl-tRNA reductase